MSASTFRVERPTIAAHRASIAVEPRSGLFGLHHATLTTTVPKELVHRTAVAEVMLTDWLREDDTRFRVDAQWPRSHSFFTPVDGEHHDPLMVAETIRQIGSLLGHAEFGVPFGHQFLLREFGLTVHPEHLGVRHTPASLDIDVTCTEVKRRGADLSGLTYECAVRREGRLVATGRTSFTCISPSVYERVRPKRVFDVDHRPLPLTAPMAPQSVGRTSPGDVVLSPIGHATRWQLRLNTRHPVLFDHPVDHVPGMLLLEAARQGAAAALNRSSLLPLGIDGDFKRYAELDEPCFIEAERLRPASPGQAERVRVTGHQGGDLVFSSVVTAAPDPD
ncbi:ScbA/BarX family gamma-butyrolactone biosynthesis protein [Streptomyces sp. SCSIO 30461]|uniref:ScbA/BarX family gamma-butyrolactone biosynthesis protein n=1 Tax=Streptomyces sp. SCSIO 30461 TaxID=3118085 RepID=UPI0030D383CD